jgi:hypothetical protein
MSKLPTRIEAITLRIKPVICTVMAARLSNLIEHLLCKVQSGYWARQVSCSVGSCGPSPGYSGRGVKLTNHLCPMPSQSRHADTFPPRTHLHVWYIIQENHYALRHEGTWEIIDWAVRIICSGTTSRWVITFTIRSLYSREQSLAPIEQGTEWGSRVGRGVMEQKQYRQCTIT